MGQGTSTAKKQKRKNITDAAISSIQREHPHSQPITTETHSDLESRALAIPLPARLDAATMHTIRVNQMRRGCQPFTKNDLIAILCQLKPSLDILSCASMSCDDLRLAIRVVLYTDTGQPSAPPAYALEHTVEPHSERDFEYMHK